MDSEARPTHAEGEPPTGCELCGRDVDDPSAVITWTLDVHEDGDWEWICPECSRERLRDIEARLDLDEV